MKPIYFLLICCFYPILSQAQTFDIFSNKTYETSTNVVKVQSEKSHLPPEIEIYQDKNKSGEANWKTIEDQLFKLSVSQIEDEVSFFKLQNRASVFQQQFDELKRLENPHYSGSKKNPSFKNFEIKLISVLNQIGTYYIQYHFGEVSVKDFYLADFQNKRITPVPPPSAQQQEILKKISYSKFTYLYLLQTKKLDLKNVERIRAIHSGKENTPDFSDQIDYSEARVYPYFTGIMIEFPKNSVSSAIFDQAAFRILIKGQEMENLLSVYPAFKSAFSRKLQKPTSKIIQQLDQDELFSLQKFRFPPKEMELIRDLIPENRNIFSIKIENQKLFFNKNDQIERIEFRNEKDEIYREERYGYDHQNRLLHILKTQSQNQLELYYYEGDFLSYKETVEIQDYHSAIGNAYRRLEIRQNHVAYHQNYRYEIFFNSVGELKRNLRFTHRNIRENDFCTDHSCILRNASGKIIGIQQKNQNSELLMNENNQVLEAYFDDDREEYLFGYDQKGRIKNYASYVQQKLKNQTSYEYTDNPEKPVILRETIYSDYSSSQPKEIIYEIDYRN